VRHSSHGDRSFVRSLEKEKKKFLCPTRLLYQAGLKPIIAMKQWEMGWLPTSQVDHYLQVGGA
jgi:hypothetical protein